MARLGPCPYCAGEADFEQPMHSGPGGCYGRLAGYQPGPAVPTGGTGDQTAPHGGLADRSSPSPAGTPTVPPPPGGAQLVQCPDDSCGQLNPSQEPTCVVCGTALANSTCLGLRFPWGAVLTPDPVLVIGRDPHGPLGSHLAGSEYDRVSRRHAMVATVADGLVVEDLGSTNGTTVNDRAITGPTTVQAGDRVSFSRALTVEVTPA